MEDFSMPPCAPTCTPPPAPHLASFKKWVEKELHCFSYGSAYYDSEILELAEDIVKGDANDESVNALKRTIAWRRQKQTEIHAIADKLVMQGIIPSSVFVSPIQLLPISSPSYKNRKLLIELVPEFSTFIVPPEGDSLQIMFYAPLYWLAILLARARAERPETCCLERVVMALVDLGVAQVPAGRTKEGYVRELTFDRELQAETLYLGMDEITHELSRAKPFFGWTLPPYNKEFVTEKKIEEKIEEKIEGETAEKMEEPRWEQVNDVDGVTDEEHGEEQEEEGEVMLEEAKKSGFGFKDYSLIMLFVMCVWAWSGIGLCELPNSSGIEGLIGKPAWAFLADKVLD